ncbi:cystatin-8 [Nycticebus coucang]|uniref:cystatin-8 n=1 Tax=Nycticebus coucang TaxID=9470 RepID=UPI00234DFC28|nr:cystatin-8 [Nycticebus coucang]
MAPSSSKAQAQPKNRKAKTGSWADAERRKRVATRPLIHSGGSSGPLPTPCTTVTPAPRGRGDWPVPPDGTMSTAWCLSLLFLTLPVALVAGTDPGENEVMVLKNFKPINASHSNVKQCLWFAMRQYNKDSEDKYLFMVTNVLRAQLRITHCLEYIVDVEITRSNCKKIPSNDENCAIQENPGLRKKQSCSFLVETLPWNGEFNLTKKHCEDI